MALDRSKVLQQAQLLASRGQYDNAVAEWKKLAAETPNDGSIHNSIGDLHLKRNAMADASTAFSQAATAFKAEGATLKAIAAYKKVLKCDPTKYEVYRHLGDLNAERGLVSSAVQDYLTLAKHYAKERKPKEALGLYQKIVGIDPTNLNAQQRIAELCVQENRQDEATSVYLQLGRERSAQGRYEEAKDAYLAVLRIEPNNSEARQFVESVKKGKTGLITPMKSGGAVSASRPSEPLGPLAEAVRRMEEKQYEGAEAILNQMLSREPGNPQVCQLLARLHLQRSDVQRGDLQVALGEYRFLAGAALRAKDLGLAESLIKEFLSVQPDSVPLLELYGELCEEQQDPVAAVRQYARAVELLLAHPEPGMDGLHEELFEKVRSLSPDAGVVERLAAKMKGESVPLSIDSTAEQMADSAGLIQPAFASGHAGDGSTVGDISDDSRTALAPSHPGQGLHFSLEGAEPDGASPFEKKAPLGAGGFSLENAVPDGVNPFERKASARSGGAVPANAAPDGDGIAVMNRDRGNGLHQTPQEGKTEIAGQETAVSPVKAVPSPDHDMHFTLGVAYKNMGLYAEAREQFDISRSGEAFCLDSCLMTALCWKGEGRIAQAIKELEMVLSDARCQGAKGQAIRYELGLLYESESEWAKAATTFQSIPSFHDVPQRLLALKNRGLMSAGGMRLAS